MTLSIDGTGPRKTSKNGLSAYYIVFHPISSKRLYIWLPVSKVSKVGPDQISIPQWLWDAKKSELGI